MEEPVCFSDLIQNIILEYQKQGLGFGRTRLIKIAYLLELNYFREFKQRLTDAKWIFYKYGPYPINYTNYLEGENISVFKDEDLDFSAIRIKDELEVPSIPSFLRVKIQNLILKYKNSELNELLNEVYFYTGPMKNATPSDELDFNVIILEKKKEKILIKDATKESRRKIKDIQRKLSIALSKIPKKEFQKKFINENWLLDPDVKVEQ